MRWSDLLPYPALTIVSSKYGGSLRRALTTIYPGLFDFVSISTKSDLNWAPEDKWGGPSSKKSQFKLFHAVEDTFPNEEVFSDFVFEDRYEGDLRKQVEVDVYVPSQKLAFEFHGKHHYKENEFFGELGAREKLDKGMQRKSVSF